MAGRGIFRIGTGRQTMAQDASQASICTRSTSEGRLPVMDWRELIRVSP